MYNLTLPENCSSNCFDGVIYSTLKYFNLDYEIYNIKYLYTDYYDIQTNKIYRGNYPVDILRYIYFIDISFKDRRNSDGLVKIVSDLLNKASVGIVIDPYYCHWSPFYQKAHYTHVLLIVDIDFNNSKYVCFDVHYNSTGYIKVDFDVINNNYIRYFTFDLKDIIEIRPEVIIDSIKSLVDNFNYNIDSKKAELFNYITQTDRDVLFPEGIETSKMLINLMWIAEDKKHSKILFKYLENRTDKYDFVHIYELLSASEQRFTFLKTILIKYAMTGVLKEESLKNTTNKIFDTDVLMINELKNILGGKV